MKEITISNNCITALISTEGAEMKSAKMNGEERLWSGDPDVWARQTPILFPICGALRDGKYIYQGKEYTMRKHGFALLSEFEVETVSGDSATFLLKSNDETRKSYPFDFEFRVTYKIVDSKIDIIYNVKNMTDGDMYFSVGGHEGYACPEGIEEYDVIFKEPENLDTANLDDSLLCGGVVNLGMNTRVLPLKEEYMDLETLMFLDLKSREIELRNRNTGKSTRIDFNGFDYLMMWQVRGAGYICLEPWCGAPDTVDSDYDITKRMGIIKLSKGEESVKTHSIIF